MSAVDGTIITHRKRDHAKVLRPSSQLVINALEQKKLETQFRVATARESSRKSVSARATGNISKRYSQRDDGATMSDDIFTNVVVVEYGTCRVSRVPAESTLQLGNLWSGPHA